MWYIRANFMAVWCLFNADKGCIFRVSDLFYVDFCMAEIRNTTTPTLRSTVLETFEHTLTRSILSSGPWSTIVELRRATGIFFTMNNESVQLGSSAMGKIYKKKKRKLP